LFADELRTTLGLERQTTVVFRKTNLCTGRQSTEELVEHVKYHLVNHLEPTSSLLIVHPHSGL